VAAVARKGWAPLSQTAKDFGISESCLHRWLELADGGRACIYDKVSSVRLT
jgi:hypothetical protein